MFPKYLRYQCYFPVSVFPISAVSECFPCHVVWRRTMHMLSEWRSPSSLTLSDSLLGTGTHPRMQCSKQICILALDVQGQLEQCHLQSLKSTKISQSHTFIDNVGLILCLCPANERRHYKVTPSLIGWAQTKNEPCNVMYTLLPLWLSPLLSQCTQGGVSKTLMSS